jgi:hypothetical protein
MRLILIPLLAKTLIKALIKTPIKKLANFAEFCNTPQ